MSNVDENPFHEWIRLEQPRLGTQVVYATDDFFAPKERLIDAEAPVFVSDKYDDHGKWMDGWESRRKRVKGYDFCVVRLGVPGIIHGVDIDTSYFTGNYPPAASIDACISDENNPGTDAGWQTILERTDLNGDSHNYAAIDDTNQYTHLRLNIFPDGGVARLRVYGAVAPGVGQVSPSDSIDLIGMANGGRALCCSDEHYGSMHNLNLPDQSIHMGDGWETARRRGPGNDWVVFALGQPGVIREIELDTTFFKGNYPDRAEFRAASWPQTETLEGESENWPILLAATKLQADHVHKLIDGIEDVGVVSHVRVNIFPDGGVSRLRLIGNVARGKL